MPIEKEYYIVERVAIQIYPKVQDIIYKRAREELFHKLLEEYSNIVHYDLKFIEIVNQDDPIYMTITVYLRATIYK